MYYNLFETGRTRQRGSIEVICGSMFSGKTEELLRRLRRAQIAGLEVEIFKPSLDTRYDEVQVVSHDQNKIPSTPVDHSSNILLLGSDVDVVGIDEAQFLDNHLPEVVEALADSVDKLRAICVECGHWANYSYRLVLGEQQVMLGEATEYSPLCRTCYLKHLHATDDK